MRIREDSERLPKPMIPVGDRPILWHIMRYFAAWGHTDFVLCLGYKGDVIREYFLNYNEALFNDFVLEGHGADARIELLNRDVGDWRITFVDTGMQATIGERLKAVEGYLGDDEEFLATYGDGLTDAPLDQMVFIWLASMAPGQAGIFAWGTILTGIASKLLGALVVSRVMAAQERRGAVNEMKPA